MTREELLKGLKPETLFTKIVVDKENKRIQRTIKSKEGKDLTFNLSKVDFKSVSPEGQELAASVVISHFGDLDFEKVKEAFKTKDADIVAKIPEEVKLETSYVDKDGKEVELKQPRVRVSIGLSKELKEKLELAKEKKQEKDASRTR